MFPPLNSTITYRCPSCGTEYASKPSYPCVKCGTTPGLAANELQEKLLREARLAASHFQRNLNLAAAEGLRMLSAHDCTLGWPVVKGGE